MSPRTLGFYNEKVGAFLAWLGQEQPKVRRLGIRWLRSRQGTDRGALMQVILGMPLGALEDGRGRCPPENRD